VCGIFGVLSLYFSKQFKLILQKVGISAWLFVPALDVPAWVWGCMISQTGTWEGLRLNKERKNKSFTRSHFLSLVSPMWGWVGASTGGCERKGMMGLPPSVAGLEEGFSVWIWQYVRAVHACPLLWTYANTLTVQPARSGRSFTKKVLWLHITAGWRWQPSATQMLSSCCSVVSEGDSAFQPCGWLFLLYQTGSCIITK